MLKMIFARLQEREPVLMMIWGLLENVLSEDFLNGLFTRSAAKQYTRTLLFSDIIALMTTVVTGVHGSVHGAFQKSVQVLSVSLASHYNKINGIELTTCRRLVIEVAARLKGIIEQLGAVLPPLVPGYHTRIIDGNVLGGTQHRIKVLRDTRSAPLPGKSLVVLDPDYKIAVDICPHEDAWANERALFGWLLSIIKKGELWIADRNFCTAELLFGIVERGAAFLIRQHAGLRWTAVTPLVLEGIGMAEHLVSIPWKNGEITVRRIFINLEKPTKNGDSWLAILTTIPYAVCDTAQIAERYRHRWKIEHLFHILTVTLRCEIKTFCYPKAALFAFAVALVASNIVSTMRAAIRAVHGREEEENLSNFHLAQDLKNGYGLFERTILDLIKEKASMSDGALVAFLLACAKHIRLKAYKKAPNRGYRTKEKRGTPNDPPHVSTAQLLAAAVQQRAVAI
jgi:hypothetical protein